MSREAAKKEWWHWDASTKTKIGPKTIYEMLALVRSKAISEDTLVWKKSMEQGKWTKTATIPELAPGYATRLMSAEAKYLLNGKKEGPVPFESLQTLAKNKVIFDDTFILVRMVENAWVRFSDVKPMFPHLGDTSTPPPSGLWKAVKVAGLFAGFAAGSILKAAARAGDGPGLRTCLKCREQVNWMATRCPFCQGDPREL